MFHAQRLKVKRTPNQNRLFKIIVGNPRLGKEYGLIRYYVRSQTRVPEKNLASTVVVCQRHYQMADINLFIDITFSNRKL